MAKGKAMAEEEEEEEEKEEDPTADEESKGQPSKPSRKSEDRYDVEKDKFIAELQSTNPEYTDQECRRRPGIRDCGNSTCACVCVFIVMIFGLFVLEYKVEALGRARAGDQQPEQVREIQAAAGLRLPKAVIFLVLFRAVVLTTALVVVLTATDAGNVSCWRLCNDAKTCSCMCEFCEFCSLVQHSQLLQAGLVLCDIDLASSWPCELSREVAQVADNTHTHTVQNT
jgi:hypothetical protein